MGNEGVREWLDIAESDLRSASALRSDAALLSTYAVEPRYPLAAAVPSIEDVRGAVAAAQRIQVAIRSRLPDLEMGPPQS